MNLAWYYIVSLVILSPNGDSRAVDHDAARQPDSYCRSDGYVFRCRLGNGTSELSVEEERIGHQRRDLVNIYHSSRSDVGHRITVHRGSEQLGREL